MGNITGAQVEQIIKLYAGNNSILETAKAIGVSTVKVRKVLITEGLWESDTSIKIGEFLKQGLTTEEIANTLYMSVKNICHMSVAYMEARSCRRKRYVQTNIGTE